MVKELGALDSEVSCGMKKTGVACGTDGWGGDAGQRWTCAG